MFFISTADADILWLCIGEYRGAAGIRPFFKYVKAKLKQKTDEERFKIYIAEAAKIITENTAKISSGKMISQSYYELCHPQPQDTRTGEEIAADIIRKVQGG